MPQVWLSVIVCARFVCMRRAPESVIALCVHVRLYRFISLDI